MPIPSRVKTALKWLTPALAVSIAVPLWRTYWVETADLHVEVTQVERKAAEASRKIDVSRDEQLRFLFDQRGRFVSSDPSNSVMDVGDVERLVEQYERESIAALRTYSDGLRKRIDDLSPATMSLATARSLNARIADEFDVDAAEFEAKKNDQAYLTSLVDAFKSRYETAIKEQSETIAKGTESIATARTRLKTIKDDLDKREARVWVGSAVTNSGRGAISLRREGVLRVYLGGSSYIDLELEVDSYDTKADLQPKSSRIINYYSAPLRTLKATDQDRILAYWGQNVPCKLFMTDIDGRVYASNTFPFAQGLYQQLVYDELKKVAAREKVHERKFLE